MCRIGYALVMRWVRFSGGQARAMLAAALVSLIGAGFSAQALGPNHTAAATKMRPDYDPAEHFPGAALLEAADDSAAPASGTTGTIALPNRPVPENAVVDATIRPAQPFRLTGSATDRDRALQCLTAAIYYEAASEPDDGQRAVAQVVLNRVRHPAFPNSVCGVVYQGSERRGCQFSFACDGALARGAPDRRYWDRAMRVALAALDGAVFTPVGLATHYHTYAVTPSWNRALVMTGAFGAHFFHRWKGWWGTAAAFSQAYAGHEPFPGPHPGAEPVVPVTLAAAAAPIQPGVPARPAPASNGVIQPAYAESGTPQPQYSGDALPESTILDRWKDSGRPLR